MTLAAFFLVLVSVFLHAGWNFLSKKTVPSLAFYALSSATAALLWLPGFLLSGIRTAELPPGFWGLWLASVAFEFIYLLGLSRAYRRSDISLAYPLARALPVLLTAMVTILAGLGEAPGALALLGMAVLSMGCILMPMANWRDFRIKSYCNTALLFIMVAAVGTTGYTVIDSMAVGMLRGLPAMPAGRFTISMVYLFLIESGLALALLAAVIAMPDERACFKKLFPKAPVPMISGIFSSTAYVLILLAMGFVDNVSYIQAFRQMSLPLGVLAGVWLLREKPGKPRMAGIALVVAGLVLVSLGAK